MKPLYLSRASLKTELGFTQMKRVKASISKNVARFDSGIPIVRKRRRMSLSDLNGAYQSFCRDRYNVEMGGMADFRKSIFTKRRFDGCHFEI